MIPLVFFNVIHVRIQRMVITGLITTDFLQPVCPPVSSCFVIYHCSTGLIIFLLSSFYPTLSLQVIYDHIIPMLVVTKTCLPYLEFLLPTDMYTPAKGFTTSE